MTTINEIISVTVSGSEKPELLGGPVQAIVTIKNLSVQPVQILLPYPNPNNLSFECSPGFAKPKDVQLDENERTVPIKIGAHQSHKATYYLNRYLDFQRPGEGTIAYRLEAVATAVSSAGQSVHESGKFEGEFTVKLIQGTENDLRGLLAMHAAKLASSDPQVKLEAAEALAFLDAPVCVDYAARMLSIENLEVIGIRSLQKFSSPKVSALIVSMLSHRESAVVAAALDAINARGIQLPRQQIQSLLTSDNANVRLSALEWLAARPDQADRELISPLLNDSNAIVREKARSYRDSLSR